MPLAKYSNMIIENTMNSEINDIRNVICRMLAKNLDL